MTPKICDRIDLTSSATDGTTWARRARSATPCPYTAFFGQFVNFRGCVDHFLLQSLIG
jgi:hypothetical protein